MRAHVGLRFQLGSSADGADHGNLWSGFAPRAVYRENNTRPSNTAGRAFTSWRVQLLPPYVPLRNGHFLRLRYWRMLYRENTRPSNTVNATFASRIRAGSIEKDIFRKQHQVR